MSSLNVKKVRIKFKTENCIQKIYDIGLFLYLFSHTAVGWNENFIFFRNLTTVFCFSAGFLLCSYEYLKRRTVEINLFIVMYVIFSAWCFLSYLWSFDSDVTWSMSMNLLRGVFFVYPMSIRMASMKAVREIIWLFVLYALGSLGYVYVTHDFSSGVIRLGYGRDVGNIVNILARIGALGVILSLFLLQYYSYEEKNKRKKIIVSMIGILIIILTALCGSRAGIVAILLGVSSFIFFYFNNTKKVKWILVVLCGVGIFIYLIMNNVYMNKLFYSTWRALYNFIFHKKEVVGVSLGNRTEMIKLGLKLWADKPLFGWGMGSYEKLNPYQVYAHNNYVEILSGAGLIGFIVYYTVYFLLGYKLLVVPKKNNIYISLALAIFLTLLFLDCTSVVYTATYNQLIICIVYKICQYKNRSYESSKGEYL